MPPVSLNTKEAEMQLEQTRSMVAGLQAGVLASRWDEVGLVLLEVFPKVKVSWL